MYFHFDRMMVYPMLHLLPNLVLGIHVPILAEWVGITIIIKLLPGHGFQYAGQRGHQHRFPGVPMIAIALESDG